MSIFDMMNLSLLTVLYGLLFWTRTIPMKGIVVIAILFDILLLLQWFMQGFRWNYGVLYVSAILTTMMVLMYLSKGGLVVPSFNHIGFKLMSLLLVGAFALLLYAFPVPKLSQPTGTFSVGTTLVDVTDPTRMDPYAETDNLPRKIMFQVWYPVDPHSIETAKQSIQKSPWLPGGKSTTKGLATLGHLPSFVFNQLAFVDSNAYLDVPISLSKSEFPVILLSHGWSSSRLLHVNMAEALASNGYIVVGIEHTYGSVVTNFADGSTQYFSQKTLPSLDYSEGFLANGNRLIQTFSGDILTVLTTLESIQEHKKDPDILAGHLDLEKIGIIGHSTGGGAAVLTSLQDSRIKSLLAFDPWVEPIDSETLQAGLTVPTLFLRSDEWKEGTNDQHLYQVLSHSSESTLLQVKGSDHSDFTLMYLFSPLTKALHMLGEINGDELSMLQAELSVAYFNETLLNIKTDADAVSQMLKQYDFLTQEKGLK